MIKYLANKGNLRWFIITLIFFATTINYFDRFILGILAPSLGEEIGWSENQYSYIISAFQIAYGVGNITMGFLIDKLGTRIGYALAVALWSISSMTHALARSWMHIAFSRFGLGIGEAGNFPAAVKSVAEWFPKKERAFATGLFNSGSQIGVILASLVIPVVVIKWNWQIAFLVSGIFSFLWLIIWLVFYRRPQDHEDISDTEMEHIISDAHEKENDEKKAWITLLKVKETWAIALAKLLSDPVWWFYIFWGAKFFGNKFGIDITTISIPFIIIYGIANIGGITFGGLSSVLIKKGYSINKARKVTLLICALMVFPVAFITQVENVWIAVALMSIAAAGHCGWSANVFTLVSDIFPKSYVGSVVGIGNTTSTGGAAVASIGIGLLLSKSGVDGYTIPFMVAACGYMLALAIVQILSPKLHPLGSDLKPV